MPSEKYLSSLRDIVKTGKPFNIKFFVLDNEIEENTEAALNAIFSHFGRAEISGMVYTCVKELMINGTKANLKRILFEGRNIDINNEDEYVKGMLEFRNFLHETTYRRFLNDLKSKDYWVNVKFIYSEDGMRIEVVNNAHISKIEDRRLREKLRKAMGYNDMLQFYMEQGDEVEGAGMGIALIVMLLRGVNADPSYFRIGNTPDNQTFARLEIPFNANYKPLRQKN